MPHDLFTAYNSLTTAKQQEVYDFIMFLSSNTIPKLKQKKELQAFGVLQSYANTDLWSQENEAWQKNITKRFKKEK